MSLHHVEFFSVKFRINIIYAAVIKFYRGMLTLDNNLLQCITGPYYSPIYRKIQSGSGSGHISTGSVWSADPVLKIGPGFYLDWPFQCWEKNVVLAFLTFKHPMTLKTVFLNNIIITGVFVDWESKSGFLPCPDPGDPGYLNLLICVRLVQTWLLSFKKGLQTEIALHNVQNRDLTRLVINMPWRID